MQELGTEAPEDIGDVDLSSLASYDGLVVGAPTVSSQFHLQCGRPRDLISAACLQAV